LFQNDTTQRVSITDQSAFFTDHGGLQLISHTINEYVMLYV